MIKTSLKAATEISEALANGAKVYCHFKQGERYQVRSISGSGANSWVILSTVGPVNFFSRRIENWEIVYLNDIHDDKTIREPKKLISDSEGKYLKLLRDISLCGSEWSVDDNFYLLKIPSYLWKELIEITSD